MQLWKILLSNVKWFLKSSENKKLMKIKIEVSQVCQNWYTQCYFWNILPDEDTDRMLVLMLGNSLFPIQTLWVVQAGGIASIQYQTANLS